MLHSEPLSHKTNDLPVGITRTWRERKNKNPYLEFQVAYINSYGERKTKHIYVGVNPTQKKIRESLKTAKEKRAQYVMMKENEMNFREL